MSPLLNTALLTTILMSTPLSAAERVVHDGTKEVVSRIIYNLSKINIITHRHVKVVDRGEVYEKKIKSHTHEIICEGTFTIHNIYSFPIEVSNYSLFVLNTTTTNGNRMHIAAALGEPSGVVINPGQTYVSALVYGVGEGHSPIIVPGDVDHEQLDDIAYDYCIAESYKTVSYSEKKSDDVRVTYNRGLGMLIDHSEIKFTYPDNWKEIIDIEY